MLHCVVVEFGIARRQNAGAYDSQPARVRVGARFCIVIPHAALLPTLGDRRLSAPPAVPLAGGSVPAPRDVTGTHVLVIDDSEANRRFATFAVAKLGCTVSAASDGDEAVGAVTAAVAAGKPYDVVLMDIVMVRAHVLS